MVEHAAKSADVALSGMQLTVNSKLGVVNVQERFCNKKEKHVRPKSLNIITMPKQTDQIKPQQVLQVLCIWTQEVQEFRQAGACAELLWVWYAAN